MEIDILTSKFLAGEASADEISELNRWRESDESNETEYQHLCESWNYIHTGKEVNTPDKEKVWGKILDKIISAKEKHLYPRALIYKVAGIAATAAVIICSTLFFFLSKDTEKDLVSFNAPDGQKAQVALADGTNVSMNSNTKLSYYTDYSKKNRSVRLSGQAYFNVQKDPEHPFSVMVRNIKVVAYGTSFEVDGYDNSSDITVSLQTGHVGVFSYPSNKLIADMKPNQKLVISMNGDTQITSDCNPDEAALWRNDKLKINGDNLDVIARKMESWYGVKISINNVNTTKRYWLTVKKESLSDMLDLINHITPITYSIRGKEVNINCRR
jgi:transmembrane sensor